MVESVLSTGDGATYETSLFILSPADGQWIIKLAFQQSICFTGSERDDDGTFHDILGLKFEDSDDCTNIYFNIEPAVTRMFGQEMIDLNNVEDTLEIQEDERVILKKGEN